MSRFLLRAGGYAPEGSTHSRALDCFRSTLAADAGDAVEVELIYNVMDYGRPATDLFAMVDSGELAWCYFSSAYLCADVPELAVLEIPFLFDDLDGAHRALDGELGARLAAAAAAARGCEILGFWDNGFRHLTNRLRPVRTPEDCEGLSIRLQPNAVHEALAASWGMRPVPAELSEGIALVREGKVDAQENPLANTAAYGVDHRHVTLTGHLYGARCLYANASVMAALPDDIAAAVRRSARAAVVFQREAARAYESELQASFAAEGRRVVQLANGEREAFADAATAVVRQAEHHVPSELLELLDCSRLVRPAPLTRSH